MVGIESSGAQPEIRARAVVLAVPADRAAALVSEFAPDASRALDEIPYAAVASVVRAYARSDVAHPLDGFGFLAPRVEKRRILGTLFSTSMFEGRAPQGTVLLTTYVGGRRDPELALRSEAEIAEIAGDELASLVGASREARLSAVTRWPRAIPQYTLGHANRVGRAERVETVMPGLFLCASYRGGVSAGDCIKSAHRTADAVAAHLDESPRERGLTLKVPAYRGALPPASACASSMLARTDCASSVSGGTILHDALPVADGRAVILLVELGGSGERKRLHVIRIDFQRACENFSGSPSSVWPCAIATASA